MNLTSGASKYLYMSLSKKLIADQLLKEIESINNNPFEHIDVWNNNFKWYLLIKGPPNTDYESGYYIAELSFPDKYPSIPDCKILTPNGKYLINKKIHIFGPHLLTWEYTIQQLLPYILKQMLDDGIVYKSYFSYDDLDYADPIILSKEERKYLAIKTVIYNKTHYPELVNKFPRFLDHNGYSPEHIKNIHMFWLIKFSLDNNLNTDMINYIFKLFYYII